MAKPDLKDYVDVAARIKAFKEVYPEGSLQSVGRPTIEAGPDGKSYIWYGAMAYRSPDDPKPGTGWASEPFPGTTNFTRNSELQNAETSAWGRAITAAMLQDWGGRVASREEVQNRLAERDGGASGPGKAASAVGAPSPEPSLSIDQVQALVSDLDSTGVERQALKLWLVKEGVQPARSFESTLAKLSPEQALELKAWARGEREEKAA